MSTSYKDHGPCSTPFVDSIVATARRMEREENQRNAVAAAVKTGKVTQLSTRFAKMVRRLP
jgi:hypothetical protein